MVILHSQIGSGNHVMFGNSGADFATSANITSYSQTQYHYLAYSYFSNQIVII